jgi:hypothetical protein
VGIQAEPPDAAGGLPTRPGRGHRCTGDEFCRAGWSLLEAAKGVPLSLRPRSEPITAVLVIDVGALGEQDAAAIDALARLQLVARRLGGRVRLRNASPELQELLRFMGLDEALPCEGRLRRGPKRQTEKREQARGIEEEGELDDPAA